MRRTLLALMLACGSIPTGASAEVSVGIGINVPGVSIGVNIPAYPELVQVPSYPVYYAPGVDSNLFFYDGMYWVYQSDRWYASTWYNGPWTLVAPEAVPVYVLRVPVRYYRAAPPYFSHWRPDAPPRWGEHWGHDWERRHRGWDHWNRHAAPPPAPLPVYQRRYSADRYPPPERQHLLQSQNYRYQPRDVVVRQHFQAAARPDRGTFDERQPRSPAMPHPNEDGGTARGGRSDAVTRTTTVPPPPRTPEHVQRSPAPSNAEPPRHAIAPSDREPQRRATPDREPQGRAVSDHDAPRRAAAPRAVPTHPEAAVARPVQRGAVPAAPERSEHGQRQEKEHDRGDGRAQDKRN